MAGENGTPKGPDELTLDLEALRPKASGVIRINGVDHDVWSLQDIRIMQLMEFLDIDRGIGTMLLADQVKAAKRQAIIAAPTLSEEILDALTMRQIMAMRDKVVKLVGPPAPAAGGPGSDSSSPSSAVTTAEALASSSV